METVNPPEQPKQLGGVRSVNMNFKSPPILSQDMQLDMNALTLMTGKNGTGKSFMMKMIWAVTSVTAIMINNRAMLSEVKLRLAQYYITGTFVECQLLTGSVTVEYESGTTLEIVIADGLVTHVNESIAPNLQMPGHPKYFSANMRLMIEVVQYMKFKRALNIPKGFSTSEESMAKLLDMYRLYDIMHAESVLACIEKRDNKPEFIEYLNEKLVAGEDGFNIKAIVVDYESCDIKYQDKDGLWLSVATMGAGHQALLNMFVCQ